MARKLKTYRTSIGFYDLVIAAPSMKAALEAWGANSNLFHQGFAHEVDDEDVAAAALERPGVILKRPVGTDDPFTEHPNLPDDLPRRKAKGTKKPPERHQEARPDKGADDHAARKAALAFEQEQEKRERERRKADAAEAKERARRERAVDKAKAAIDAAGQQHEDLASVIEDERRALETKAKNEDERWMQQRLRLTAALKRAEKSG